MSVVFVEAMENDRMGAGILKRKMTGVADGIYERSGRSQVK